MILSKFTLDDPSLDDYDDFSSSDSSDEDVDYDEMPKLKNPL